MTHHNELDMRLYMRIAPELFLKQLVRATARAGARACAPAPFCVSQRVQPAPPTRRPRPLLSNYDSPRAADP